VPIALAEALIHMPLNKLLRSKAQLKFHQKKKKSLRNWVTVIRKRVEKLLERIGDSELYEGKKRVFP